MTKTATPPAQSFVQRRIIARMDAIRQEMEWHKCKNDFVYWWNNYWVIEHPSLGATVAPLYPEMEDLNHFLDHNIHTVLLKARQIGCSTFVAGYVFHKLFFFGLARSALFFSKNQDDANELLAKIMFGWDRLPDWMRVRGPKRTNKHKQHIMFSNGSSIRSLPSKRNAGRSRTAWIVVLDEWAFYEDPANAWSSVQPVADVGRLSLPDFKNDPWNCGGRMIALSTADQSGDFFNDFWNKADPEHPKHNGFASRFLSALIPPGRGQDWYEAQKKALPEWQLHREFPIDAELAFIKSGNPVFDTDSIRLWETIEGDRHTPMVKPDGQVFLHPAKDGLLTVFHDMDPRLSYTIGADTAQGLDGGDFSSADIVQEPYYDTDGTYNPALQVAHFHGSIDPDLFGTQLSVIGKYYNNALIVVEANNHGNTTLNTLFRYMGYTNIYYRKIRKSRLEKRTREMGFYTSRATKAPLIDNLKTLIRENDIVVSSPKTKTELMSYVRSDNGTMSGNPNDDCVMSLAMAGEGLRGKMGDLRTVTVNHDGSRSQDSFDSLLSELRREARRNDSEVVR